MTKYDERPAVQPTRSVAVAVYCCIPEGRHRPFRAPIPAKAGSSSGTGRRLCPTDRPSARRLETAPHLTRLHCEVGENCPIPLLPSADGGQPGGWCSNLL